MPSRSFSPSVAIIRRGLKDGDRDVAIPFIDDAPTVTANGACIKYLCGESAAPDKRRNKKSCCRQLRHEQLILVLMVFAVVCGVLLGVILRAVHWEPSTSDMILLNFPGEIFLRMLNLLILPLVVSTLVTSLANVQAKVVGRMGMLTAAFYLGTTILAIVEAIALTEAIRPGTRFNPPNITLVDDEDEDDQCNTTVLHSVLDIVRNIFPENLIDTAVRSTRSCFEFDEDMEENGTVRHLLTTHPKGLIHPEMVADVKVKQVEGMNVLGVVVISVAFGITISRMGQSGRPLADLFAAFEQLTVRLIFAVIWFAPVGVTFLIATEIVKLQDPVAQLEGLALYVVTVLSALAVHAFILLPAIFLLFVRKNPATHYRKSANAFFTGVATCSSTATIPVTLRCCEQLEYDSHASGFVLPLGASLNMTGSALYEAIAALYIAQVAAPGYGIGRKILIALTATLVSVIGSNIPSAGSVTMLMAMNAAGLPAEYAAWVIPTDWFLDRIRTGFTVLGDTVCAAIVSKFSKEQLAQSAADSALHDEAAAAGYAEMTAGVLRKESSDSKQPKFFELKPIAQGNQRTDAHI